MTQKETLDRIECTRLKGVGPRVAENLKRLGIVTVQDLLFHLPLRYEDRTTFKSLNQLRPGDHVQVQGLIVEGSAVKGRRGSFLCRITDKTGYLSLRFFHCTPFQEKRLSEIGSSIQCYGEVRWGMTGYEMVHPECQFGDQTSSPPPRDHLTPIYPTTEGLTQHVFRKLTEQALDLLQEEDALIEYLPEKLHHQFSLTPLKEAIELIHRPPIHVSRSELDEGRHPAKLRLSFEELLAHQLSLAKLKLRAKTLQAVSMKPSQTLVPAILQKLPFKLTLAQQRVVTDIAKDLACPSPMCRLVQGDVGSGKTIVAALSALQAIEAGYQVALMAPTELLAEQHYRNFNEWFSVLGVTVAWVTGSTAAKARSLILAELAEGSLKLLIGTHALFQSDLEFKCLRLIIIDEQHRFGVDQRLSLLMKGGEANSHPHQLVMSATPIPRTLAMTAYADLDCSIIDELPPGRTPVKTVVLPNSKRQELIERVRENCKSGAQAYWVCTLIQESELLQCQAAEEIAKSLSVSLPTVRVALLHGRMKSKEKETIMTAFKNKAIDLLVATTVVEVGVDVPNATLMVIENAERLGLAQLHQLRGRVGRGAALSHCVLLYQAPLSHLARERLAVMRETVDGFKIAQKDLALRGPGEVLGTRQKGLIQLKIADLVRDHHQLPDVQKAANLLLQEHPHCVEPLIQRWLSEKARFKDV